MTVVVYIILGIIKFYHGKSKKVFSCAISSFQNEKFLLEQ